MNPAIYYVSYLGICLSLILWLARVLNRSGAIFLNDAFGDKPVLIRAISHLLDIGFYLMSFGYLALTVITQFPMLNYVQIIEMESVKVGGFLLMLGCVHLFNLLLLAVFRRRTLVSPNLAAPHR